MFEDADVKMSYLHGHANIGYGTAHNLVMHGGNTHYHLVLNPDVELARRRVARSRLRYLDDHTDIGVLAPARAARTAARISRASAIRPCSTSSCADSRPRPVRRLFR